MVSILYQGINANKLSSFLNLFVHESADRRQCKILLASLCRLITSKCIVSIRLCRSCGGGKASVL